MVMIPIKISAGLKFPPLTNKPITSGTTMDARLPIKLKTPPVNPIKCFGARVETKTQVIVAKPFPKKASAIKKMMSAGLLT